MASEAVAERSSKVRRGLSRILTVLGPFLGLILVTGFFAWQTRASGTFTSATTWRTILVQTVTVGIAALGMTLIMIAGGIDLSIGSTVALVTVVIADLASGFNVTLPIRRWLGMSGADFAFAVPAIPVWAAMLGGILCGGLCGAFNGQLITRLGVVPFIVTLGSLKMFRGLAKWISGSNPVYVPFQAKPVWLEKLLSTRPPVPAWLTVAPGVWVLMILSLAMAVGSSEPTARLCGIDAPKTKRIVYLLAGLATGLAGAMQFAHLDGTGDPTVSDGLELQVIAAVVIGGGSLWGGEGTVLGTLIGCVFITVLDAGCIHADYNPATRDVLIGLIIVAAVTLDRLRRRG
jgi:ribose/xylose/arabinose/galactoside ABC-type transport system permease subunit